MTTGTRTGAGAGTRQRHVDLTEHVDNLGIVVPRWPHGGGFNIWGNAFPADELPPAGGVCTVDGVSFSFPLAGNRDNIRCRGQVVALPPGHYDWLYVLAAAERRTEDTVRLHYTDGSTAEEWLRISDFWPDTAPRFGDLLAFRCSRMLYPRHPQPSMAPAIWQQRIPVSRPGEVHAVRLPDNPAMHVFALTAVTDAELPAEGWPDAD
ncbi:hypothetical protein ACN28G_24945 [Micromonospora sp. WMMA1923]|uniref:hypothetical protein n=1 Tax=Micromonospora sp. WMMA1923 TaxID=3404125 RepID=UPI003B93D70E